MATFKLAIRYEGFSSEEIVEIEAKNPNDAKAKCKDVVSENKNELDRLARYNVYVSKNIRSCRLCPYDHKMDMLEVEEMLRSLKDEI